MEKSIFKAYDIRGIYPDQLNEDDARLIGRSIAVHLKSEKIILGRDGRPSGISLLYALKNGIKDMGIDVIDIGMITTPMISFAAGRYKFPGVIVTASHNPRAYNGFKIIDKDVLPVGLDFGLDLIRDFALTNPQPTNKVGKEEKRKIYKEYIQFLLDKMKSGQRLRCCIDTFNGSTPVILKDLLPQLGIDFKTLNFNIDGTYPKHAPNPLDFRNLNEVSECVKNTGADFGVVFDGDGDRCVFVDERGKPIPPDLITGLIAREIGVENEYVLCDVRTSKGVWEEILRLGGKPERVRVGHAYARRKLKELDGILGGELAGHYYFREMYYADSGILALIHILNFIRKYPGLLSKLVLPLMKYSNTGEINYKIQNKDEVIEKVRRHFANGKISTLDGLTIEDKDWWFNLRKSNTEPYLRLIVEAKDNRLLEAKRKEVETIIRKFGKSEL